MIFLILGAIVLLIILIIVIFLRKRISIAIELIEEGSIAIGHMMSTLFFPIVPFVWQFLVIIWFVIVAVFLASSGVAEYRTDLEGGGIIYEKCKGLHKLIYHYLFILLMFEILVIKLGTYNARYY